MSSNTVSRCEKKLREAVERLEGELQAIDI